MAYDLELADRLRECLQDEPDLTEKAMFGGLAFLINGNMAVSAGGRGGGLLLRVDPKLTESLVADGEVERFVMRGRELNGWLHVPSAAVATSAELARWVTYGVDYARSLEPK